MKVILKDRDQSVEAKYVEEKEHHAKISCLRKHQRTKEMPDWHTDVF